MLCLIFNFMCQLDWSQVTRVTLFPDVSAKSSSEVAFESVD